MTLEGTDVIYGPLVAEKPPWRCLWGRSLFGELMKTMLLFWVGADDFSQANQSNLTTTSL